MTSRIPKVLLLAVLLIAVGVAGFYLRPSASSAPSADSAAPIAQPGPGSTVPPAGWLSLWDATQARARQIDALQKQHQIKELIEAANLDAQKLNRSVPTGCIFSPDSRHFELARPGSAQHKPDITSCAPPPPAAAAAAGSTGLQPVSAPSPAKP